jgi:HEAT repeat protein
MDCHYYKQELSILITGFMEPSRRHSLLDHLAGCPDCRAEFETLQRLWAMMGDIPQPSPSSSLQERFESMLDQFRQESLTMPSRTRLLLWMDRLKEIWHVHPIWQIACSVLILVVGLGIGFFSGHQGQQSVTAGNRQIDSLSSQVSQMKQLIMLSLLENPSASERMRAVSYTDQITTVNKKVIDALLTTLNQDANVNVRLVTLETLVKLSGDPGVRQGLVQSITQQESPLVQSAIADAMVKLQEKAAVKSLEQLLRKKDLNEMVRIKIQQSIHRLI